MYNGLYIVSSYSSKECSDIGNLDACGAVSGNMEGSYLTMVSTDGLIFGIINIIGNFGTVFLDQAYWQCAFAAKPTASQKGYLLGGLVWFAIPFSLATSLGLATVALQLPVTVEEAAKGLVPPAAALYMLGKGGAVLITVMIFMAVTSTGSGELIAVSLLLTYDVYGTYFNRAASDSQILFVSRFVIVSFGMFMGCLAVMLNSIGIGLGYVYLMMGVLIGSAVVPVAYCVLWSKCTAKAAVTGALSGQILGICIWVLTAYGMSGEVSIQSTGKNMPMLAGNLTSIVASGLLCTLLSLRDPDDFDFEATRDIGRTTEDKERISSSLSSDMIVTVNNEDDMNPEKLSQAKAWIVKWGCSFTVLIAIVWPSLSLAAGAFSLSAFSTWVVISLIWSVVASFVIVVLPITESWAALSHIFWSVIETIHSQSSRKHPQHTSTRTSEMLEYPGTINPLSGNDDA